MNLTRPDIRTYLSEVARQGSAGTKAIFILQNKQSYVDISPCISSAAYYHHTRNGMTVVCEYARMYTWNDVIGYDTSLFEAWQHVSLSKPLFIRFPVRRLRFLFSLQKALRVK